MGFTISFIVFTTFFRCNEINVVDLTWAPIQENICGTTVDFQSAINVADSADVATVFELFIQHSKADSLPILGGTNNWRFESTSPHGVYEGVKYWKVAASWFDDYKQQWRLSTVFNVSEHGSVVHFLGCI